MNTRAEIEIALRKAFPPQGTIRIQDTVIYSLAMSIERDPVLSFLTEQDIISALSGFTGEPDYVSVMARIKALNPQEKPKAKEIKKPEEPAPDPEEERRKEEAREATSAGMFVECWDSFLKHGHLLYVKIITVSFAAEWIRKQGKMLSEKESQWCCRRAGEDSENAPEPDRERAGKVSNDECIVLVVMHKFKRMMKTDPAKILNFIEAKRQLYTDYFVSKYGEPPVKRPLLSPRACATSARFPND